MSHVEVTQRHIMGLALPMAAEQLVIFGVFQFNTLLAGRLGVDALSAHAVVTRWIMFTLVGANITGVGASILIAQSIGQRRTKDANEVVGAALLLALIGGAGFALLYIGLSQWLLSLMGVEAAVQQLGIPYLQSAALAFPLNFLLLTAAGCLRGAGDARTPLLLMGMANLVHIVLASVLATGLASRPGLGLPGIGWSMAISSALGAVLALGLLLRGIAGLRLSFRLPDPAAARNVWRLGRAVGGEQLVLRLAQLANIRLVAILGTGALAAYAVALESLSFMLVIGVGFMMATLTLVGQQVGAGTGPLVRRTAHRSLYLAWAVLGAIGLSFWTWPEIITGLFTSDPLVASRAIFGLRLLLLGIPFEAVNQVFTGGIRGAGDTRFPMLVSTLGHWLIRIPLILIFIRVLGLGLGSVWVAMILEMTVRSAINRRRMNSEFWLRSSDRTAIGTQPG